MSDKILKTEIKDQILLVTISRPNALNALNSQFFDELNQLLDDVEANKSLRVMVLTGEGKAFVAGADIAEMVDMNPVQAQQFSLRGQATFFRLEQLSIPVIAAVNGFALGGGCELMQACDIRIASSKAKFGQPEVNLGLTPGYAGTQRLPRQIGCANAMYLLLTGDMISAEEALRMGLVQKIVEPENLLEETFEIARIIVSRGPNAVAKVKKLVREGMRMDFSEASKLEAEFFSSLFGNEGTEGMRAFLEKKKPSW